MRAALSEKITVVVGTVSKKLSTGSYIYVHVLRHVLTLRRKLLNVGA